jgi:hypothetical protein
MNALHIPVSLYKMHLESPYFLIIMSIVCIFGVMSIDIYLENLKINLVLKRVFLLYPQFSVFVFILFVVRASACRARTEDRIFIYLIVALLSFSYSLFPLLHILCTCFFLALAPLCPFFDNEWESNQLNYSYYLFFFY